jgi:uncharacterized protein YjiS (DUF1127 family)
MSVLKFAFDHEPSAPSPLRDAAAFLVRLTAPAAEALAAAKRWRSRRHAYMELMALDERLLKDIGLSRGRIEATLYGDFDRPSECDAERR